MSSLRSDYDAFEPLPSTLAFQTYGYAICEGRETCNREYAFF